MAIRRISNLNSQIVLNSGSISNPENKSSIIRNSERVRYDLVNLAEYINGLVHYTFSTLTNSTEYPYDAAESGISGLTLISDTGSTNAFSDVFWLATGENTGRPKTIKESLEAMEAKLIQQNVNISVLERVDLSLIANSITSTNEIAYKVKNNVFGNSFNAASENLTYPLSEYVYRLYKALITNADVEELNTGVDNFPALQFSSEVSQDDIPGCGFYLTLSEELAAIKNVISDNACDPSFNIVLDQSVFDTEPSNIKEYISEYSNKISSMSNEIFTNASDISNIENSISGLQGAIPATAEVAGIVEKATSEEIIQGVSISGVNPLYMGPQNFINGILNTNATLFSTSGMGLALKEATKRSIDSLAKVYNPLKGLYSIYLNVDSDVSASFICQFGRHYNVNTRDKNVTLTFSSLGSAVEGQRIGIKNNGDTGELKINSGVGHTIDNLNELVLLVGDYVEIMKTSESNSIIISKYKA
jgi:hypothetical protein